MMCLAHGLDAERGGQLAEEQPRSSPRRAVRHGVEERAQRCSGGAVVAASRPAAAAAIALCLAPRVRGSRKTTPREYCNTRVEGERRSY